MVREVGLFVFSVVRVVVVVCVVGVFVFRYGWVLGWRDDLKELREV